MTFSLTLLLFPACPPLAHLTSKHQDPSPDTMDPTTAAEIDFILIDPPDPPSAVSFCVFFCEVTGARFVKGFSFALTPAACAARRAFRHAPMCWRDTEIPMSCGCGASGREDGVHSEALVLCASGIEKKKPCARSLIIPRAPHPHHPRQPDPPPCGHPSSSGTLSSEGPTTPAAGEAPPAERETRDVGVDAPSSADPDLSPAPRETSRRAALARRLSLIGRAIATAFTATSRSVADSAAEAATNAAAATASALSTTHAHLASAASAAWAAASQASLALGAWTARPPVRAAMDAYLRLFVAACSAVAVSQLWRLASSAAAHARLAEAAAAAATNEHGHHHPSSRTTPAHAPTPSCTSSASSAAAVAAAPAPQQPPTVSWTPLASPHTARASAVDGAAKLGASLLKTAVELEGALTSAVEDLVADLAKGGKGGGVGSGAPAVD